MHATNEARQDTFPVTHRARHHDLEGQLRVEVVRALDLPIDHATPWKQFVEH